MAEKLEKEPLETEDKIVQEATLSRIRNLINENKIKLWLDPYYDVDKKVSMESKMLQTANALAPELELDDIEVFNGLLKLQNNALEKLKARDVLNQSNKLELKLKLDKHVKQRNPDLSPILNIKIDAYDDGEDLTKEVSKVINVPPEMFKLVSAGSVIKNNLRLHQQKIKPGQTVMVLTVDQNSEAVMLVNEQRRILSEAKEDAEILGDKDEMTIADQNGRQVELPKEERKAIIIAMSLHEKGKSAMKRGNFPLAIVLLLEAKDEYNTCRSEILTAVDNYGNNSIFFIFLEIFHENRNLLNETQNQFECLTANLNTPRIVFMPFPRILKRVMLVHEL